MDEFELETRGNYRAVIGYDEDAEHPDHEGQGTIVRLDRYDAQVMRHGFNDPISDFDIGRLWEYWGDMELVERHLRMFQGVVGFDYFDTHDGKYIVVVTEADLREWGWDSPAEYQNDGGFNPDPSAGILDAWKHWVEGEVYYYAVQQRVHRIITVKDANGLTLRNEIEEGWETVDSCHGFYGRDYVDSEALASLDSLEKEG